MRRRILIVVVFGLLVGGPKIYAHVAGAFGDFLVGIEDESTTEDLKKEIRKTRAEIEVLVPKVEQLGADFSKRQESATEQLLFYHSIGLDTYANLLLESGSIVDALANTRLIERNLDGYMKDLNKLYLSYRQLQTTKESLEGHEELLNAIEKNLDARARFMKTYGKPGLSSEENNQILSQIIAALYQRDAYNIDEMIRSDSSVINEQLSVIAQKRPFGFSVGQEDINKLTTLTYYLRSDHIYIHHQKNEVDMLLIGNLIHHDDTAFMEIESGFINGVLISDNIIKQLQNFAIEYNRLPEVNGAHKVEQAHGQINFKRE